VPWPTDRLLTRRALQVCLGWLWLLDAGLQAEPANFSAHYPLGQLAQSAMGAPAWENHLIFGGIRPFAPHWAWWNLAAIALQAAIGLCLVRGRLVKPALVLAFAWCGVIWLLGEGLGMLPTGFALMLTGAPGPAVLYALLGALAWPHPGRRDVGLRSWAVLWSALWGLAALLQLPLVYSPQVVLRANFVEFTSGQRAPLAHLSDFFARLASREPVAFSLALGLLELAIVAGWWLDRGHARRWLALGIALSALFWVVGQGLGGILSPGATDPSSAPLVVLLALAGWPRRAGQTGSDKSWVNTERARSSEARSTRSSG
jgi:hypothetical protein